MREATDERKHDQADAEPEKADDTVTMVTARDLLGDLVNRARLMGARTVLTRNGKEVAAIIPIADYRRLVA